MMITSGIKAQYTMGTTGMMNIPTAEMQQTGTFMIGGNYLPEELNPFKYNSGNYFVNITFFSFLELNYRCILLKSDYMAKKPKFNQQDRSLSVRLRPLKEVNTGRQLSLAVTIRSKIKDTIISHPYTEWPQKVS